MAERINSFDYIRVLALMGILLCHSCFKFPEAEWMGRYLAQMFNFVFLILSAFLLGLAWRKHDYPSYGKDFLVRRFTRLMWSYYPYILVLALFFWAVGEPLSVKSIVMQIGFLSWFDKIPGFGHTWFLTMIAMCYIGCQAISKISNSRLISNLTGGVKVRLSY